MGQNESKAQSSIVSEIISFKDALIRLDSAEIKMLERAGRKFGDGDNFIEKHTFMRCALGILPHKYQERVYEVFGGTKSKIAFQDLVCGLTILLKGTVEERKKFIFALYDYSDNGHISRVDMLSLLSTTDDKECVMEAFNKKKHLSFDSFGKWMMQNPKATGWIAWSLYPPSEHFEKSVIPIDLEMLTKISHLTKSEAELLEKRYHELKNKFANKGNKFTAKALRRLACPPLTPPILKRLCEVWGEGRCEEVGFREVLLGVSTICLGDEQEFLIFCFKFFDFGDKGKLSEHDLDTMMEMLESVRMGPSARRSTRSVSGLHPRSMSMCSITSKEEFEGQDDIDVESESTDSDVEAETSTPMGGDNANDPSQPKPIVVLPQSLRDALEDQYKQSRGDGDGGDGHLSAQEIEFLAGHSRVTLVGIEEPHTSVLHKVVCRSTEPEDDTDVVAPITTVISTDVVLQCDEECPEDHIEEKGCNKPSSTELVVDSGNEAAINVTFLPRRSFWMSLQSELVSQYFLTKRALGSGSRSIKFSFEVNNKDGGDSDGAAYLVSASYEPRASHAAAVPYAITHDRGTSVVMIDQRATPLDCRERNDKGVCMQGFQPLGVFSFGASGRGSVVVSDGGEDTIVTADKISLAPVQEGTKLNSFAFEKTCAPIVCKRGCGSVEKGGGTCKTDGVTCTSCNSDRVKFRGKCLQTLACKASKVPTGALAGESCRCTDKNCHYCIRSSSGDKCRRCKNGFYELDGECVESCPSTLTASGNRLIGRTCTEPFTCKNNRILESAGTCNCPDKSCHTCSFNAGGNGSICSKCKSDKFLHGNECLDDCSHLPQNSIVSYNPGALGRECRAPFTCDDQKDTTGAKCKCPKDIGGVKCRTCGIGIAQAVCIRCDDSYLYKGACLSKCPALTTPVGQGTADMWCASMSSDNGPK
eukprot:m.239004 g.239004  ORF g.239004 m.239004 type:complete len:928 (+) comp33734_c0_seq4:470-3253(+)